MSTFVDIVFLLRGRRVAAEHADRVWQGLRGLAPWLEDEPEAGVHPLGGLSDAEEGGYYLSRRSRLTLRVPLARVDAALALTGTTLDLGAEIEIGRGSVRALLAMPVLYAHFVTTGHVDEQQFMAEVRRQLAELGHVAPQLICGKAQRLVTPEGEVPGFSLMIHSLNEKRSLELLQRGLGNERKRGGGVFVPHKSIVAVGDDE